MGKSNACNACGKRDCDCDCDCDQGNLVRVGATTPDFVRFQTVTDHDFTIGPQTTQVDVCGDQNTTGTLPDCPRFGRAPLLINNIGGGTVTLVSDDSDIQGQNSQGQLQIPPHSSAILTFSACGQCGIWSVLLGEVVDGVPEGQGIIYVPNIAALAALDVGPNAPNDLRVIVQSLGAEWELLRNSTAAPDGITLVPAVGGGNWGRLELPSKLWSSSYLPDNLPNGVQIDPLLGDDENTGYTPTTALKTTAEACRRLAKMQVGKNYVFQLLNDVPETESVLRPFAGPTATPPAGTIPGVLVSDRFRPSFLSEENPENIIQAVPGDPATRFESTTELTLTGLRTTVATSTMPTGAVNSGGNVQANFNDAAFPGTVGDMIEILNDPTTPSNNGATAFVGRFVAGNVRISDFITAAGLALAAAPSPGTTYRVVRLTRWAPPILRCVDQGLFVIRNLDLTPPTANERGFIAFRFNSIRWEACRFQRSFVADHKSWVRMHGCAFVYPSASLYSLGTGQGLAGTTLVVATNGAVFIPINCLFLNAGLENLFGSTSFLVADYFQNSYVMTENASGFRSYPDNSVGVNTGSGGSELRVSSNGIRVFDWPLATGNANAGVLIGSSAICIVQAGSIGGSSAIAGSIGVVVRGSSKLLTRVATSDATWINGAAANVRLDNPKGLPGFAMSTPAVHADPVAALTISTSALGSGPNLGWNEFAATPFLSHAFCLDDGGHMSLIP
jgi:hypothetical protein